MDPAPAKASMAGLRRQLFGHFSTAASTAAPEAHAEAIVTQKVQLAYHVLYSRTRQQKLVQTGISMCCFGGKPWQLSADALSGYHFIHTPYAIQNQTEQSNDEPSAILGISSGIFLGA